MKVSPKRWAFLLKLKLYIIWLLHIGWTFQVIPTLLAPIPVHFGLSGKPDRWGGPTSLWAILAVSVLLGNFLLLLSGLGQGKPTRFAPPSKPVPEGLLAVFMSFCALMIGVLFFTGALSMAYWKSAGPILHGLALLELAVLLIGVVVFSWKAVKYQSDAKA
jgi:hypothetical protein